MRVAEFEEIEKVIRPVVRNMARAYSRAGAGDAEDLAQEGLIALSKAFQSYDGSKANVRTYARGVLTRKFNNALRDVKRQKRAPLVWRHSEQGWKLVPCPTLASLDQLVGSTEQERRERGSHGLFGGFGEPIDPGVGPEADAVEGIDQSEAVRLVMDCLDEFQAKVFRLWLAPSAGLLATARNLTGSYTVQVRHIAIYLGVPSSRVEAALREVRAIVAALDGEELEES